MRSCAESFARYGADEGHVSVILAPDVVLMLFVDGSAIFISTQFFIVYESCWSETMHKEHEPSLVDFYE